MQPILDRVKEAIEDMRVEGGYSMIFNADQGSPIVAVDKNLNVTERVLAKLRGTTASAPTAPKPGCAAPRAVGRDAPARQRRLTRVTDSTTVDRSGIGGEGLRALTAAAIAEAVGGTLARRRRGDRDGVAPLDRAERTI